MFGIRPLSRRPRHTVSSSCTLESLELRTMMSAPADVGPLDAAPSQPAVYAPHSKVKGHTIGEWSADWWKWALSFSSPDNPITDTTGANANLGQKGPVYFLAGTSGGEASRTFTVPGNKPILVPLLVGELSQLEVGLDKTPQEVRQMAADQADLIDSLHLTIDGVAVGNLFDYREASPDFSFTAAAGNPIGVPAGDSGVAVADGYFVMLRPLGPGEHVIEFGGGVSSFDFSVAVTDTVTSVRGHHNATPPPFAVSIPAARSGDGVWDDEGNGDSDL